MTITSLPSIASILIADNFVTFICHAMIAEQHYLRNIFIKRLLDQVTPFRAQTDVLRKHLNSLIH